MREMMKKAAAFTRREAREAREIARAVYIHTPNLLGLLAIAGLEIASETRHNLCARLRGKTQQHPQP